MDYVYWRRRTWLLVMVLFTGLIAFWIGGVGAGRVNCGGCISSDDCTMDAIIYRLLPLLLWPIGLLVLSGVWFMAARARDRDAYLGPDVDGMPT